MSYPVLRKRISCRKRKTPGSLCRDMEFVANKSSGKARKIVMLNHNLVIELWFNQHYYERYYMGDAKGKREGIDPAVVESLVARCVEHLFLYGSKVKNFRFVNADAGSKFPVRTILQESKIGSTLNVVIEVHQKTANRFEVTVITAMANADFKMASGQYCVKLQQDRSVLRKNESGKVMDICSFKLNDHTLFL